MSALSTVFKNAVDAAVNIFAKTNTKFSDWQQSVEDRIDAGNVGITANAWDVDALAKDGGAFAQDKDNTVGLTFAFFAGRTLWNGKTIVNTAAGTVALSASLTNYVEVNSAGVVSANTAGFTTNRIPLYVIVAGVSTITTITNKRILLSSNSAAGITGDLLSQAASTKKVDKGLGTLVIASMPYTFYFHGPSTAAKASQFAFSSHTGQATSDVNYVTFTVTNITNGNAVQLAATSANTSKATGGSAIVADGVRVLALTGTSADLNTAGNDLYSVTIAKTGTPPADLTGCEFSAEWTFTN